MSQRIKGFVKDHTNRIKSSLHDREVGQEEILLIDFILLEIAEAERRGNLDLNRLAHKLAAEVGTIKRNQENIMIDQATIDASIGRLETDVHNLIAALPGNTTPSTPDTVVTSLLGRVDGLSTAAEAALAGTGTPTPVPPPTP